MPCHGLLSITLASLILSPLAAEDRVPAFVDMRLSAEIQTLDYEIDTGTGPTDQTFDTGLRTSLSYNGCLGMKAWGGIIWGVGVSYGYSDDELDYGAGVTSDVRYQTGTIDGFLGYGYAFNEHLQIEALPLLTVGKCWIEEEGGPNVRTTGDEGYWEYGLRGNVVFTFGNGFQVGGTASVLFGEEAINAHIRNTTNGVRYQVETGRMSFGAFIGARL